MSSDTGKEWLTSLLEKQLCITVSDGRVFHGTFMCTDNDGSAILAETQEYRDRMLPDHPSADLTLTCARRSEVRRADSGSWTTHYESGARRSRLTFFARRSLLEQYILQQCAAELH